MSDIDHDATNHADTAAPQETIEQRVERGRKTDRAHDGAIVPFPGVSVVESLGGGLAKTHQELTFGGYRVTEYRYRIAAGDTIQVVLRYDHPKHPATNDKIFRPIIYYGRLLTENSFGSAWIKAPRPLYGLDRLESRRDAPVLVVEGEKTAEAASRIFPDHVAITWMSGAYNVPRTEMLSLAGRNLVLWPDNDSPGRDAMRMFAAKAFQANAASIRMATVPADFGEGWDLADDPPADSEYSVAGLLYAARSVTPSEVAHLASNDRHRAEQRRLLGYKPGYSKVDIEHVKIALSVLDADMYGNEWRRIARCLFYAFDMAGLACFDEWSQGGAEKYREGEPRKLWETYAADLAFRGDTLAWLFRKAANKLKNRGAAEGEKPNVSLDQNAVALSHIEEMSEEHAVVMRGGKSVVLFEHYDPRFKRYAQTYLKKRDFEDQHIRKLLPFAEDDKDEDEKPKKGKPKMVAQASLWFNSTWRRYYENVYFSPGQDLGPRLLNTWRGFAVDPVDEPSRWSRFQDHLRDHVACGDAASFDYILNWMAFSVQHLDRPVKTALILIGKKGSGKSIVTQLFGHLFGQHTFVTPQMDDAIGRFNDRLETTLLLGLEEAVAPNNKQADGNLKHLVTSETLRLEGKFFGIWDAPNHLRIIVTSNNEHVVRADGSDRRYAVFDVTNPHQPNPDARLRYFGAMVEQMETGGYEAMLGQLLRRDVSRWNAEAIPETAALMRQKQLNLAQDPVQSYLFDRLTDGIFITTGTSEMGAPVHSWSTTETVYVPARDLNADFKAYADAHGMSYSERKLSMQLPRYMPEGFASIVRREIDVDCKTPVRVYPFPPLEKARRRFEEVTGLPIVRETPQH